MAEPVTDPTMGRHAPTARCLPSWFGDAKLGIFVHWGAYSVPAWSVPLGELGKVDPGEFFVSGPYAEWYANTIRIAGSPAARHHAETYGDAPYDAFLDAWHAERFDPAEWAQLFSGIGARYVVLTTKHHDGICLWDAPGTGRHNTVNRGPKRDLVGELATATRAAGLRFGTYYSGGLDWHHSDFPPITQPQQMHAYRPVDADYANYAEGHLTDLIDRYAPDVLWNDINWPDAGKDRLPGLFQRYYRAVPEGVVNDRWQVDWSDFLTSEYSESLDNESAGRPWEHNRGIGYSFGYSQNETAQHCLSGPALVRRLVDVVARGGNLLLNIGPRADGSIPELQREPLEQLGAWLSGNGEAIFNTRPWSPVDTHTPAGITFTANHAHLYAHIDGPDPTAGLPLSTTDVGDDPAVTLLGHGPVPVHRTPAGLRCSLPQRTDNLPRVLRIDRAGQTTHA